MTAATPLLFGLFLLTLLLALASVLGLPLLLRLLPPRKSSVNRPLGERPRGLSLIVPVHGSAQLLTAKFASLRGLEWPDGPVELILSLDGAVTDLPLLRPADAPYAVRVVENPRQGKYAALNAAVAIARGDLLIFSDLDARLSPGAVETIAAAFVDQSIGAACGRVLVDRADALMQGRYWEHEAELKTREEAVFGSITASNGTLLALRRRLFEPIPAGVVDDLYIGLTAVIAGYRFAFVPAAVALIGPPAETLSMVIRRQRRIVCRGLTALRLRAAALSLRCHGRYALALMVHKVLRRLFPLAIALAYLQLALLSVAAPSGPWLIMLGTATLAVVGAVLMTLAVGFDRCTRGLPRWVGLIPWVLCVNVGIVLGWKDFLSGRRVTQW